MENIVCCIAPACDREARYKKDQLCQKHYFRKWRNGYLHLKPKVRRAPTWKALSTSGYTIMKRPDHPIAQKQGLIYEHRLIMYAKYGEDIPPCELCGAKSDWRNRNTHIDHIDENKTNNHPSNLRVLCNSCNVNRSRPPASNWPGRVVITHSGKTLTAQEWSRQPGVVVSGACIRGRIRRGWGAEDAIYRKGMTHHGWKQKPPAPPKHTRKNAITLVVDGEKMTAAEWARHPECFVKASTIVSRKRRGLPDAECIFKKPSTGPYKKASEQSGV